MRITYLLSFSLQFHVNNNTHVKVSGHFVETSCVFQCIKNIINAEMGA